MEKKITILDTLSIGELSKIMGVLEGYSINLITFSSPSSGLDDETIGDLNAVLDSERSNVVVVTGVLLYDQIKRKCLTGPGAPKKIIVFEEGNNTRLSVGEQKIIFCEPTAATLITALGEINS